MTNHMIKELKLSTDDVREFAKWCTDSDSVVRHLALWDLAFVNKSYLEFGEMQTFAAVFALWRAMLHGETVGIVAKIEDASYSIVTSLYESMPNFLKSQFKQLNRSQIMFDNDGMVLSIRPSSSAMCGRSFHRLIFVNYSKFAIRAKQNMMESILPVMSSRPAGCTSMYIVEEYSAKKLFFNGADL